MFRTAFRNLVAHKLRLLSTAMAVVLGVGFMTGTLVFGDTLNRTFDDLFASVYEETDTVVRGEAAFDDPTGFGAVRGRIDASVVDTVAAVDGVAEVQPGVFGFAQLVGKDGDPIGNMQAGRPTFGGNWYDSERLQSFQLVVGTGPSGEDEAVIDRRSAEEAGYRVGDTATVLVLGGPHQVRISGIAAFGEADTAAGATFVMFDTASAQRLIAEPGKVDSVSVAAEEGVSQAELTARIARVLPDGTEAVTGEAVTEETQDAMQQGMSVFSRFLLIFAVIALLVAGFMIFNTFFITVAQRTRENALLRAIGASRRQVLASVLLEALLVGVVASGLGLGVGVAVAVGLKAMLAAIGISVPAGGIVFTSGTALTAMATGLVVTLVAAVSPARNAGKVPPVAAMRGVAVGSTGYGSKERIAVGTALLVAGVGALVYGLVGSPGNALAVVGLGALVVFFAVSVLGRTVSLPLSRVLGWPLPRLRGVAGHLARQNAMRNPKRTAATASALMIGVGLVVFITVFATSTKASFNAAVDRAFTGDVVVTNGAMGFGAGGLDPAVAARLDELPEAGSASGLRAGMAEIGDHVEQVVAVDPGSLLDMFDVQPVAGSPEALDADGIAVWADVAEEEGLEVGDRVPVVFRDSGRQELTVAMIYAEDQPLGEWMLGTPAWEANVADQFDAQVFVRAADGVTTPQLLAAVERATADYPGTDVLDQDQYKADQMQIVDQLLGLVYALLALAILIALLGIGNTLTLSIVERTRELGVMRAVGMTRAQLRSTIRWESVIIALQGTVLGLVIGLFFGWALVSALADQGLDVFRVPFTSLASIVVLAALAGVAAAVLPARRAAKLDVLGSIASE